MAPRGREGGWVMMPNLRARIAAIRFAARCCSRLSLCVSVVLMSRSLLPCHLFVALLVVCVAVASVQAQPWPSTASLLTTASISNTTLMPSGSLESIAASTASRSCIRQLTTLLVDAP